MKLTVTGRKIHITDGICNHLIRKMNKTMVWAESASAMNRIGT